MEDGGHSNTTSANYISWQKWPILQYCISISPSEPESVAVRSSKQQQLRVWMLTSPLTGVWSGLGRSPPSRLPLPAWKEPVNHCPNFCPPRPWPTPHTSFQPHNHNQSPLPGAGASTQSPVIKHTADTAPRCSSENGILSWCPRTVRAVHHFLPAGVISLQNDITLPCINHHPAAWEPGKF